VVALEILLLVRLQLFREAILILLLELLLPLVVGLLIPLLLHMLRLLADVEILLLLLMLRLVLVGTTIQMLDTLLLADTETSSSLPQTSAPLAGRLSVVV
jgi:hypothetical protein